MQVNRKVKKSIFALISAAALAGCIDKEKLVKVPDAENILFTSAGDLIVSGGKNIYKISKSVTQDGSINFSKTSLYDGGNCSFGGIAQSGDWVYTVCAEFVFKWKGFIFSLVQDNHLLAANINDPSLQFYALDEGVDNDPLDSLAIPNGIAVTPTGQLAIADENFFAQSSVGRITLDLSDSLPRVSHFEKDWLGAEFGVQSPNGVQFSNGALFVSDQNKVRKFYFDENGEVPLLFSNEEGVLIDNGPEANAIYQGSVIIDDIMPYCGGIAVTHYLEGQLVYQDKNGEKYSTLPFSLESPSALAIGQPPLFQGNELLVTEKGILLEHASNIGNHLTKIPMDFDLNDPSTCDAIMQL